MIFDCKSRELFPLAINAGIGGQNSKMIRKRFDRQVLTCHPAYVHILAGTNDDIRSEADESVSRIIEMALAARKQGATVTIGTIPPYNEKLFWQAPYASPFNIKLKQAAEAAGIAIADYYAAMIDSNGLQNREIFMDDGIHQNAKGAQIMMDVLRRANSRPPDQTIVDYMIARYSVLKYQVKHFGEGLCTGKP